MNFCRETAKMVVPQGNRPAVPRDWFRGVPERYVAGIDTRGRLEGRPYPWSQQVIHETSGQGLGSVPLFSTQIVAKQLPAVFVLMAVHAQVFPVRAVRGIVPVVPVFMVHSQ